MTGIEFLEAGGAEALQSQNSILTAIVIVQAVIILVLIVQNRKSAQRRFILRTVANSIERGGWTPLAQCMRGSALDKKPTLESKR